MTQLQIVCLFKNDCYYYCYLLIQYFYFKSECPEKTKARQEQYPSMGFALVFDGWVVFSQKLRVPHPLSATIKKNGLRILNMKM
jgi:hypothetical protein